MTEGATNVEFVGTGMPEQGKEPHPAVKAVKGALAGWWERVGPGSVEKSWVAAHRNILEHINGEDRKKAFERSADSWKRIGTVLGYTSTFLDFGIGGLGIVLSIKGWKRPQQAEGALYNVLRFAGSTRRTAFIHNWYHDLVPRDDSLTGGALQQIIPRREKVGRGASVVSGIGSLGIFGGVGPAHVLSRIAAGVAGKVGEVGAHTGNYVVSGKAAEHAKAVGGAIGKGAEATIKYASEHPDEIRKTLRTVDDISRQRERDRDLRAQTQKLEAERQLQREYKLWMDSLDGSLRSYYEQNHQWPPPMADFLKEREGFMKNIRKQQEKTQEKRV